MLIALLMTTLAVMILSGCGSKESKETSGITSFFPEKTTRSDLTRISDVRVFKGKSLWEYIDGGAEIYHQYNFLEVATADYKRDNIEVIVDIYKFDGPLNAFGLYSMLNPENADIVKLGVEGFVSPASVNFVKGEYLIRITGFEESSESDLALINTAEELNESIPGTIERPVQFGKLPEENRIPGTDKYYYQQFMGQVFLGGVFSRNYAIDADTVTLFISDDNDGGKFLQWSEFAEQIKKKLNAPAGLPFDAGHSFIMEDNYYGNVIAGLKSGKLAGMINFKDKHKKFLTDWLSAI